MPITVDVPELGRPVEFPDDMSHDDIASAITQHLGSIAESGLQQAVGVSEKAASMFNMGRKAQELGLREKAKAELKRQQREAQVAGDIAGSEAASAGVGEQVAEFARTFPQRAVKAPFELAQAAGIPIGKPTLSPDDIAYLRSKYAELQSPLTPPQPAGPKEQAITDWLNEQASGMTSPEMVAAVGTPMAAKLAKMSPEAIQAAGRVIARGFQAQMAAGVPEAVQATVEAPDTPSRIKAGLSATAAVGLPLAIEAGLTKPTPKIPDYPGSRIQSPERGVVTALGNEEMQAEAKKQAAMLELGRSAAGVLPKAAEELKVKAQPRIEDVISQAEQVLELARSVNAPEEAIKNYEEVVRRLKERAGVSATPSPVENVVPAIKTMSGEVVAGEKGQSHNDIIEQNKIPAKEVDRREFVDTATGQEVSREKLAEAIPTKKEGEAHSSDLAKAQEAAPTPAMPPPATEAAPPAVPPALPKLVSDVLSRPDRDANWVWMHATKEEKAAVDKWVVDTKHPLATQPGTAEGRFKALVQENIPKSPPPTPAPVKAEPSAPPPPAQPKGETAVKGGGVQRVEKLKPGYVRLWRGGTAGKEGLWFSDDKEVAKFHYENHQYDAPATLSYVDVPKADADKYMDAAFTHPDVLSKKTIAESGDHVLPPEVAANARVVRRTTKPTRPAFLQKLKEEKSAQTPTPPPVEQKGVEPLEPEDAAIPQLESETPQTLKRAHQAAINGVKQLIQMGYDEETVRSSDNAKELSKRELDKAIAEARQNRVEPEKGPGMVGMGGALLGEVGTGYGADIYGIAERVRAERAKAGQVEPVEPGQGVAAEAQVVRGRELIAAGANPDQILSEFEQTKRLSSDDMAVVRAHGEELAKAASNIEIKFGTETPEYLMAHKALSDWDRRSKAMQTEWHKTGMAQQGETDIDTGTFTGLQRAYEESTGKQFTPDQAKKAKVIADKSAKANTAAEEAKAKLNEELKKEPPVSPKVKSLADRVIASLDRSAESALMRIKKRRAEGRLFTGIPVEEMTDYAIYGASKFAKGAIEFGKWSEEMIKDIGDFIKPHLKEIWDAADKRLDFEVKRLAPGEDGEVIKARIKTGAGGIAKAERRAFDAAKKTVRENAIRIANLENKSRVAEVQRDKAIASIEAESKARGARTGIKQTRADAIRTAKGATKARLAMAERDKATADVQLKAAKEALDAANKTVKEHATKVAETERKLQGDPMLRVWNRANVYLEKGLDNFDDIRNKVATDLGMSVKQVTRLMAQSPRVKYLADEVWRSQQQARRLKEQARRWVDSLSTPGYVRAIQMIPRAMFGLKVGFHGTVALGTHAPMVAFQPKFWSTYVQNFGRMYKLVGWPYPGGQRAAKAYYEKQVQELMRDRPGHNYTTARRAGLVNDPFVYEDYNSPDTAKYFGNLTGMGNRGYTVLKILRQDMFDQMWNNLPKTSQIPEVAQAIADGLNHATGVVKGRAPAGTNIALFAPRLEASRVMWLAGDPIKMLNTFANWDNASLGDKTFAMNQLKEKAWVFGTLASLLALNQGFLTATGSKQKINGVPQALGGRGIDPMESDFLKFKAMGLEASYGSAMLNMAKLPARMATSIMFHGKTSKLILEDERVYKIAGDYIRSQLSPFAGTATDLALGRDYAGRPLPRALFGAIPGPKDIPKRLRMHGVTKPYTWGEYSSIQFTPIPISEGIREVWGQGLGMSDQQIDHYLKAWAIISIMAGTGGRVTEDRQLKK